MGQDTTTRIDQNHAVSNILLFCKIRHCGLRIKANTDCPGSLILEMSQASPSDMATMSLSPLLCSQGLGQICTPHLLIILTKPACHHNIFWGSRCDSNQVHTVSHHALFHGDFSLLLSTHRTFHRTGSFHHF